MSKGFNPRAKKEQRKVYLTDTHNVFKLEQFDSIHWLVTNLELQDRDFLPASMNLDELIKRSIELSVGVGKPTCQCWVEINTDIDLTIGLTVIASLSHHPAQAFTKGIPKMTIEKVIGQFNKH